MTQRYILIPWIVVLFLVIGCATTQPQVQVTKQSVYVEKPKRVDVNTVISQLSHQISSTMLEQNKRRVAVMNFSLVTGEMTELGLYLSDKLTNSLFQYRDKFEVIERTRLESVLKEIKLAFTGIIDDKTAQSIGKILGADAIVIGTITDLGEEVDINIRMLGTERANVLAVASALLEKSGTIARLMTNVKLTEPSTTKIPQPKTDTTAPPSPSVKAQQRVQAKDFIFELQACKAGGQAVSCLLTITNKGSDKDLFIHATGHNYRTRIFDDFGNEYQTSTIQLGNKVMRSDIFSGVVTSLLVSGVPTAARIDFDSVSQKSSMIALFELSLTTGRGENFVVQFRNIPLTR